MVKPLNLIEQRFARLTVIKREENDKWGGARWLCKCDCGNEAIVGTSTLRQGLTKSCGCLGLERARENIIDTTRHNMSRTKIYRTWGNMKSRCYNQNHKSYAEYGGRGIKICDEWLISDNFFKWALENGYSDDLTIDRIDVNGNYEPSNCRWASTVQQMRNRRTTIKVIYEGEETTLEELSDKFNIPYATLHWRYKQNFPIEKLIKPVKPHKEYKKRS